MTPTKIDSFPGEAVDKHLKEWGHLPTTLQCDEVGTCMNRTIKGIQTRIWNYLLDKGVDAAVAQRACEIVSMLDEKYHGLDVASGS